MKLASDDVRKRITRAISSGEAMRTLAPLATWARSHPSASAWLTSMLVATPAGQIATQVLLYAPRDGTLGEVTVSIDGAEPVVVGSQVQVQDGGEVGAVDLTLAPGQSARVQVRMSSAAGQDVIGVERTPGLDAGRQGPELRCAG